MIFDWQAKYPIKNEADITNLTKGLGIYKPMSIDSCVQLLAQAMVSDAKSFAQAGDRRSDSGLKVLVHRKHFNQLIAERREQMISLNLLQPNIDLNLFPVGSWLLQINFILAKPYISKDDEAFYIIDNPVKKEKVFRVPYVSASTWKGNLREALRLNFELKSEGKDEDEKIRLRKDEDEKTRLLMGNERNAEEKFRAGRLHFFPTYFDQIDLEVINPHERISGAGKLPIYLEVVPKDSKGTFRLLYVPFDQLHESDETRCQHAWALLAELQEAMKFLLLDLGIAAKKSSGFGVAAMRPPNVSRKEVTGVTNE